MVDHTRCVEAQVINPNRGNRGKCGTLDDMVEPNPPIGRTADVSAEQVARRYARVAVIMTLYGALGLAAAISLPRSDKLHMALFYASAGASFLAAVAALSYRDGHRDSGRHFGAKIAATIAALRAAPAPCALTFDLPQARAGEGYLYVIKFSTGGVKVGQTVDPRRRVGEHARDAGAFGVVITDYWISQLHPDYLGNEVKLIRLCLNVGPRAKREYFHTVTFNEARAFAHGLTHCAAPEIPDASVPR